jgi:hypothetical protein
MKELWEICKKSANKNIQVSSFTERFPFSYFEAEGIKNVEIFLSLWMDYVNSLEDAYDPNISYAESTRGAFDDYLGNLCIYLTQYGLEARQNEIFSNVTDTLYQIYQKKELSIISFNYDLLIESAFSNYKIRPLYLGNCKECPKDYFKI